MTSSAGAGSVERARIRDVAEARFRQCPEHAPDVIDGDMLVCLAPEMRHDPLQCAPGDLNRVRLQ